MPGCTLPASATGSATLQGVPDVHNTQAPGTCCPHANLCVPSCKLMEQMGDLCGKRGVLLAMLSGLKVRGAIECATYQRTQ